MRNAIRSLKILVTLYILCFSLSLTGCVSGDFSSPSINPEVFIWDDIPTDIQNQFDGAGCAYAKANGSEKFLMINGLLKINGIYENLEDLSQGDYNHERYENARWIVFIDMNESGDETGTMKIRSKENDGEFITPILRSCGT
jgi:hypothetical protein